MKRNKTVAERLFNRKTLMSRYQNIKRSNLWLVKYLQ